MMNSPVTFALMAAFTLAASARSPVHAAEAASRPAVTLEEKCAALHQRWRDRFEAERLSVVISPPFVVAGDGGPARVERYVAHTIQAASAALHREFFDAHLDEPVLILLFESAEPYTRLAGRWFGDKDVSPYGYFRGDGVMVMNVGTGTGTLVHELVHALIRPDFPGVPAWMNEGLGSLFEQCTLAGGSIRGLPNWRLPALQQAIRDDRLRPIAELLQDPRFYRSSQVGLNYAHARYLLMYLQEKDLLQRYYQRCRDRISDDPTGLQSLRDIIAPRELDDFEQAWRDWVLELRFN